MITLHERCGLGRTGIDLANTVFPRPVFQSTRPCRSGIASSERLPVKNTGGL